MRILWLNWKDRSHPLAGGAEVVTEELIRHLAQQGNQVTLISSAVAGAQPQEMRHGYTVIRLGGRYSVYWKAYRYYRAHYGEFDLVIDEVNTIPFFAGLYAQVPVVNFFHQLAREIWFYEMSQPLSLIGYLLEPLYLRLIRNRPTIVVSQSTKSDLEQYGYRDISVISEGITLAPLTQIEAVSKASQPTVLSLGALRSMKRTLDIVKAFELAKEKIIPLKLVIAGSAQGAYSKKVVRYIQRSRYKDSIEYLGPVSTQKKLELMRTSHALAVASVKEGWCLVVTECASQGTPAAVYDVDGLRDSVQHDRTGLIAAHNTPAALAEALVHLLTNQDRYRTMRQQAWEWSKTITFEQSCRDLLAVLSHHGLASRISNRAN